MQVNGSHSSGISGVLLGIVAVGLAGMVGTVSLIREAINFGPKVGDIVSFDPLEQLSRDIKAQIPATVVGATPDTVCILDVRAIHATGGSMIIEARQLGAMVGYRVHWAGPSTSGGDKDCGTSVDLLLRQDDIEFLAMAAGGFGVAGRKQTLSSLWGAAMTTQ